MCSTAAIGAVGAAYISRQQAQAQADQQEFQARLSIINADIEKDRFAFTKAQALGQQRSIFMNREATRGAGQVGFASGNVLVGEGSALDWEIDLEENAALASEMVESNLRIAKWDSDMSRRNLLLSGSAQMAASNATRKAANNSYYMSLIGGVAQGFADYGTRNEVNKTPKFSQQPRRKDQGVVYSDSAVGRRS